jgi:hypothetical protein
MRVRATGMSAFTVTFIRADSTASVRAIPTIPAFTDE